MGQHSRSESLFYYFRIEDQVPENHLLRLLDRHISYGVTSERKLVGFSCSRSAKYSRTVPFTWATSVNCSRGMRLDRS